MNLSIVLFPLIPNLFLWAICLIVAVLSIVLLFSESRNAVLRLLCFVALITILANPHIKTEDRKPLKNIVLVLTDNSVSQSLVNREALIAHIHEKLSGSLNAIKNLEIKWVQLSASEEEKNRENSGTLLYSKLKQSLNSIPKKLIAGAFLITDGQVHDVPKILDDNYASIPVHLLLTGRKGEFDLRLETVKAPRFGLIGSSTHAKIRIMQDGGPKLGRAILKVRRGGQLTNELVVEIGSIVEIPIHISNSGANIFEVEVVPVRNELTEANNKLAIITQGVRENLRVLLVSGEPHLGERTWRNLLKSDASVDLVHFTILRPPEKQDGTPINQLSLIAFPTRELFSEKLNQFDLIIFDRYRRRGVLPLLYLDNITRYVEQGGALLVAAGKTFSSPFSLYRTPLSQILPAEPTGRIIEKPYRAEVTSVGKKHPVTRNLPGDSEPNAEWGRWFRLILANKKQGDVLMQGPNESPLLILNRLGKGRVALLLSDHAWLWARGYDGGGPHTILLRRLSHWLMKEPDLEEEYLSAQGYKDKIIIERRSMKETIGPIVMQHPNGDSSKIELQARKPGVWQKTIKIKNPGLYYFKSGKLSTIAQTGSLNSLEMSKVTTTDRILEPVVNNSSGGVFWAMDNDKAESKRPIGYNALPKIISLQNSRAMSGDDWMAIRDRNAYQVKGVIYTPIITGLLALLSLMGLFTYMWFRESK